MNFRNAILDTGVTLEDRLGAAFWKVHRWNKNRWQLRHQIRQLKQKKSMLMNRRLLMEIPRLTITAIRTRNQKKIMHSRKAKVMLQQKDDTFALESSANVRTREPKEASVVGSSPHLIVCFAAPEKMAASNNASPRETVSLPETVYVTAKRVRLVRLSERVENSLYLLILAAALGYLVIAILGL
jgi:hypothetical protein